MASRTSWASIAPSVPATGPKGGSACACAWCSRATRPSSPSKCVVTIEKSCSPRPSVRASSIA